MVDAEFEYTYEYQVTFLSSLLSQHMKDCFCLGFQQVLKNSYFLQNVISQRFRGLTFFFSQGNAAGLVYTDLIEKCYLTLTQVKHFICNQFDKFFIQAMKLGLGGNPYGPAGTGKTEAVKALGRLMGRQVKVFNCDEGIDIKSMGRIFIGLVKCGAWGCFDEFNRLAEQVGFMM